uniref:Uncharacterized protein n=1 Tax=viral metagenome TaxID=1070528 RepID=A0A6M3KFJ7_9ZZZZ
MSGDIVTSRPIVVLPKRKMLGMDTTQPEPISPQTVFDKLTIGSAVITTAMIQDLAVTTAKINALAVTTAKINALAVTNAQINDLDAAKITAGYLSVNRLEAGTIAATKLSFSAFDKGLDDLDDVANGATYGKILLTDISAGHIKLSEAVGSLDDIDNGATYGRIAITDISSGHILLSETIASGEWYSESGVDINASSGINIYGVANALTTRATKTGTIQCYVGADGTLFAGAGSVKLNVDGLLIGGAGYLQLYDAAWELCGTIEGASSSVVISAGAAKDIRFNPGSGSTRRTYVGKMSTTVDTTLLSVNTNYQNTTDKLLLVTFSIQLNDNDVAYFLIGATSPPTTEVAQAYKQIADANSMTIPITALVPVGYYYKISVSAGVTMEATVTQTIG